MSVSTYGRHTHIDGRTRVSSKLGSGQTGSHSGFCEISLRWNLSYDIAARPRSRDVVELIPMSTDLMS